MITGLLVAVVMAKRPSMSVSMPSVVPFTFTVAPMSGSLNSSTTTPLTVVRSSAGRESCVCSDASADAGAMVESVSNSTALSIAVGLSRFFI